MKSLRSIVLLVGFVFSNFIYATSLSEISVFAKEICDEISTIGSIKRTEVEGKISGKLDGIAKLLGASISAEGTIKLDDINYKGIPYEKLPEQMSDSRECKKSITMMLLKERQEIERMKVDKIDDVSIKVDSCIAAIRCEQSKMESLCICRETVEEVAQENSFSQSKKSRAYFKTCGPIISDIKSCWSPNKDLDLQRAECKSVFSLTNTMRPKPLENSCVSMSN